MEKADITTFHCTHPIKVKNQLYPCGKCVACRSSRINDWAVRMTMENATYNQKAIFVTLTYADEFLPTDRTLDKPELVKFCKRLRYHLTHSFRGIMDIMEQKSISFFGCGEYGSQYGRPHYHLIIFGLPFVPQLRSLITTCWKYGFVKIENIDGRHFHYVAKYSVKTLNRAVNGIHEFTIMSRRKAIGKRYLMEHKDEILDNQCKFKLFGREVYLPKSLSRRFLADELRERRKVVFNYVRPDDEPLNESYTKIHEIMANVSGRDFQEFWCLPKNKKEIRYITYTEFMKMLDLNDTREIQYLRKKHLNKFEFYQNNFHHFTKTPFKETIVGGEIILEPDETKKSRCFITSSLWRKRKLNYKKMTDEEKRHFNFFTNYWFKTYEF